MTIRRLLTVVITLQPLIMSAQETLRAEYFLDTDPGYGQGIYIENIKEGDNQLTLDLSEVTFGAHTLNVRSQDSEGRWSETMIHPLFIDRLQDIDYVEYYVDADPGIGLATPVILPNHDYKAHIDVSMELATDDLPLGVHSLSVRARDRLGQWAEVLTKEFEVTEKKEPQPSEDGDLARIEYFFDTDPGYGNGFPLSRANSGENEYEISLESVKSGAHMFYVRAQDLEGRWSTVMSRPIYVTGLRGIAAMEYFIDTDPGEGQATPLSVTDALQESFVFDIPTEQFSEGTHTIGLRVQGLDGLWSPCVSRVFTIADNTDGINTIKEGVEQEVDIFYSIDGKKLDATPTRRGVYIHNGKKIMVK